MVHRLQKGIAEDTLFAIAKRGVHVVSSCKKGTMAKHNLRRGAQCVNHPFCYIVCIHNILCHLYARFTPLSVTDIPPFLQLFKVLSTLFVTIKHCKPPFLQLPIFKEP